MFEGSSEIRHNIDPWEHRKSLELPKELELGKGGNREI